MYSIFRIYAETITSYEKSIEILQKIISPNYLDLAISYNNIGFVDASMERYSQVFPCYDI
jgi:hypothetical protein